MQTLRHRRWPRLWSAIRDELVWGFVGGAAILWLGSFMAEDVWGSEVLTFDQHLLWLVRTVASDPLTLCMTVITALGDWTILVALAIAVGAWCWQNGTKGRILILGTTVLGAFGLNQVLQIFFYRFRPVDVDYVAQLPILPSGHALLSLCVYGIAAFFLLERRSTGQRWLGAALVALVVLLIGFSRVYLGLHYSSDLVAGYAAAAVWLIANTLAFRQLYRLRLLWQLKI
ncbi:MAG: phosphatase PAP2 family protein [Anaerolineae bacterium]|nr:phosphatase PAP2 family protein [Anaerolineae bacterium]